MERNVLIKEIMWEYDYTKSKAEQIVSQYEKENKYDDLCDLIKIRQDISMVIREDV